MLPIYLQVILVSGIAIYVIVQVLKGTLEKRPPRRLHHH